MDPADPLDWYTLHLPLGGETQVVHTGGDSPYGVVFSDDCDVILCPLNVVVVPCLLAPGAYKLSIGHVTGAQAAGYGAYEAQIRPVGTSTPPLLQKLHPGIAHRDLIPCGGCSCGGCE